MGRLTFVFRLLVVIGLVSGVFAQWRPDWREFKHWMDQGEDTQIRGDDTLPQIRNKVFRRIEEWALDLLSHPGKIKDFLLHWMEPSSRDVQASKTKILYPEWLQNKDTGMQSLFYKNMDKFQDSLQQTINEHFDYLFPEELEIQTSSKENFKPFGKNPYPYFGFIPRVRGFITPLKSINWESDCFHNVTAVAHQIDDSSNQIKFEITLNLQKPKSLLCHDRYVFATASGVSLKSFFLHGKHRFEWIVPKHASEAEVWDVLNKGIRVLQFRDDPIQVVVDILETVRMFLQPLTHAHVSEPTAQRSLYFLREYTHMKPVMTKRKITEVMIDEDEIQNGDLFGIVRLDGLDPMLAWAMGSTTGHVTVAVRDPNEGNALYIAESTSKDSYWPTNGIQKTPFKQWIEQARAASYQLVHAPLHKKYQNMFNATKALEWFATVEGLDYGYGTMLWAWIDTLDENYPCLPPDFSICLQWEHLELLFSWADLLIPKVGDILFRQAWSRRVNSTGLMASEIYYQANKLGIRAQEIPSIVEQDSWTYEITRFGKPSRGDSLVCCTFVCKMWKNAGIFQELDNEINCGEFTNWDVYSSNLFDQEKMFSGRPQQCIDADPQSPLCQLLGEYTLDLNDYNSRPLRKHMAERCPSRAPDFPRIDEC